MDNAHATSWHHEICEKKSMFPCTSGREIQPCHIRQRVAWRPASVVQHASLLSQHQSLCLSRRKKSPRSTKLHGNQSIYGGTYLPSKTAWNAGTLGPNSCHLVATDLEICLKPAFDAFNLCSRDELPFYPSIDEWSSYLGCPNEELVNIDKPDLLFSMMYMNPVRIISEVFNFVFYGKIRNAIHKIDTEYRMELEKYGSLDFCLNHYYENEGQESFVEQYLSEEKRVIDRFLFAAKQKKKELYMKAKEDHLSIIDTMMLFVDYAFEGYEGY